MLTRLVKSFTFLAFGAWLPDSNCPFRLQTRGALDQFLKLLPENPIIPSILMTVAAAGLSMKMGWTEIRHLPRETGKSFIRSWKIFKICGPAVRELLTFKKNLSRAGKRPAPSLVES